MEEKNTNTSQNQHSAEEQTSANFEFYNVMPKHKNTDELIQPKMAISNSAEDEPLNPSKIKIFIKAHSRAIIILILIILFILPSYFLAKKYILKSYAPESLLMEKSQNNQNLKNSATSTPEKNNEDLTISNEWRQKYFKNEICENDKITICGDNADPDLDGLTNSDEFKLKTDPNNNDSDQDGLSDGDEVNIFNTDPNNKNTANDPKYNDTDYAKGGYNIANGELFTKKEIQDIKIKLENKGIHLPTFTTLGDALYNIYGYINKNSELSNELAQEATTTIISADQSLEAKQDRDAQRSLVIKNIGIALLKYITDNKIYPNTKDFKEMFDKIKIYLKVATNPVDPINQGQFIYTYSVNERLDDFTLTFYSEVANQIIKKRSADALKDKNLEEANVIDAQRIADLENLRSILLLYSQAHAAGNQDYVFPAADRYKTDLVPTYTSIIPKDPKTNLDYEYKTNELFNTFTLKTILENPPTGTTGYLCNQEECRNY